jgi:hypothetical protein
MKNKLEVYKQQKEQKSTNSSNNKSIPPSKVTSSKASSKSSSKALKSDDDDMMELLKKHNKQFIKQAEYEPSRHSVRDVRKWEKETGKTWANLLPADRELANKEIEIMKTST